MTPNTNGTPRKDRRKDKNHRNYMMRKLKVGMYVEDCRGHPCVVTKQTFYKSDLYGCGFDCESLVSGKPNACSIFHCGPVLLSKQESFERAAFFKEHGIYEYMRHYSGYSDADIAEFRKLDQEWNFDKGD